MPDALRPYQIEDLTFMIANPRCGLLHDPGGGKTPPVCVYMEYLWKHQKTKSFFVMPKSLLRKNKVEILRFTNFTASEVQIVDGTPKERAIQMSNPSAKVFLMGFKRFSDDWKTMVGFHPDIKAILIDEIHMGFKSHDSKRTKELFAFMKTATYFVAMSGTLIDGRLDSCYPTIHIIEPRYYANHWSFMAQHAITDEYGSVICWTNHEKLGFIFKKHCVRRTFEEIYGKEDPVIHPELCEMHPKQRAAYSEFEAAALLELEDRFLEGFNPAVAAIRCRQIMSHPETFKILKDGELTGKDEALLVHVEDHINKKEPLLVYAALIPEQERIYKLLQGAGLRVALINSTVDSKIRGQIDLDFQNGLYDAVVASPATASVGFNWGHVNHIIFTSLDYQNSNFVQAYKRAIRGKRTSKLWVTVLEYEDSIDQRIFQIVNGKSEDAHKVDESYAILDLGHKEKEEFYEKDQAKVLT